MAQGRTQPAPTRQPLPPPSGKQRGEMNRVLTRSSERLQAGGMALGLFLGCLWNEDVLGGGARQACPV